MANLRAELRVQVYTGYAKTTLIDDLSMRYNTLRFSSALHGGFKDCYMTVPMSLDKAWNYLSRENLPGAHFYHLSITQDTQIVWEGRIMDVELNANAEFQGMAISAFGYWSSMRDQLYDPDDAGNTDWTTLGPHNVGKIIREMITKSCPDINGTVDVTLGTRDVTGINIKARAYPQDNIVDNLAPLSDTGTGAFYFAVWENRKPYYTARSGTALDWQCWMADISELRLTQQGKHLRNSILPVVGTAEGTSTTDTESTGIYPKRELMLALPAGVPAASANEARDAAVADRRFPKQDETFTISGHVYSSRVAGVIERNVQISPGALAERPKWWVRAGQVIRIQDLVPASVATPKLDDLRTFYILEASYDAITDRLTIQPDRSASRLDVLLPRMKLLERNK